MSRTNNFEVQLEAGSLTTLSRLAFDLWRPETITIIVGYLAIIG